MKKKPKDNPELGGTTKSPSGKPKRKPSPGLPDPSTVISEETFLSPKGNPYRIIHTDQKDAFDNDDPEDSSHNPLTNENMTKRRADEPDNKAAVRQREFREARGLPDEYPVEKTEFPEEKTTKNKKQYKGTNG